MVIDRDFSITLGSSDPRTHRFIDVLAGVHRRLGGIRTVDEVPFNETHIPSTGEMPIQNRITAIAFVHKHMIMRQAALVRLLNEEITKTSTADLANTLDVLSQLLRDLAMKTGHGVGIRRSLASGPLLRSPRHFAERRRAQGQRAEPRTTRPTGLGYRASGPLTPAPPLTRIALTTASAQL